MADSEHEESGPVEPRRSRHGRVGGIIAGVVAVLAVAGAVLVQQGVFDVRPNGAVATPTTSHLASPTAPPTKSATPSASPRVTPTPSPTVETRKLTPQVLDSTELTTRPLWKDGAEPVKYAVGTLQYLQTLAKAAELEIKPVNYVVVTPGLPVACTYGAQPYINGTPTQSSLGIQWCPVINALAISPTMVTLEGGSQLYLNYAMAAYGSALAFGNGRTSVSDGRVIADGKYAACYHAMLLRQRVLAGSMTVANAGPALYNFYVGSAELTAAMLGYVTGKCFPPTS